MLNLERRVNGDPSVSVALTEAGRAQSRLLGERLGELRLDLCVHTRFGRTRETAVLALAGRDVPLREEPLFDDIDVGDLEGLPIDEYRRLKLELGRSNPFPGGESLDDAARRYATAYRSLLEAPEENVLVICHEIPIRYALNALAGAPELDVPRLQIGNASPYFLDEEELARVVAGIERLT